MGSEMCIRDSHCDELPSLFAQGPYAPSAGLNAAMARYCATGDPGWPPYQPGRTVLRTDFSCRKAELVRDPLDYVREAFVT